MHHQYMLCVLGNGFSPTFVDPLNIFVVGTFSEVSTELNLWIQRMIRN